MLTVALWIYLTLLIVIAIATTISDVHDKEPLVEIVVDAATFAAFAAAVVVFQVSTTALAAQVAGWVTVGVLVVQGAMSWRGRVRKLRELEALPADSPEAREMRSFVRWGDVMFVVLVGPMVGVAIALLER